MLPVRTNAESGEEMVPHVLALVMTVANLLPAAHVWAMCRLLHWLWIRARGASGPPVRQRGQVSDVASTAVWLLKAFPQGARVHCQGADGISVTVWRETCSSCAQAGNRRGRWLW